MDPVPDSILATALPGLEAVPIIGILRGMPAASIIDVASAAVENGIRVLEVTLDSDEALSQISRIAGALPQVTVGAGSVLRSDRVERIADCGGRFIVAPIVDEATVEAALARGMAAVPGAATPTEIDRAVRIGATAVKLFPVSQLGGVAFVKAIRSPLGHPPLVPTGGITASVAESYLEAGAAAVGAGSDLFSVEGFAMGGVAEIAARARSWAEAVT